MAKRQKKGQLPQKYIRNNEISLDKFAKRGCRAGGGGAILALHRMLENQKKYDFNAIINNES